MAEKPTIPDFPTLPDFGKMITQACEVVASVRGIPYDFNGTLSLENKFVVLFKTVKEMFDAQDELVKSYKTLYDFLTNYFNNLDVQEEVNKTIQLMADNGSLLTLFQPAISNASSEWLSKNITNPSSPPIDKSLSVENAAADAKITGTKLLKDGISYSYQFDTKRIYHGTTNNTYFDLNGSSFLDSTHYNEVTQGSSTTLVAFDGALVDKIPNPHKDSIDVYCMFDLRNQKQVGTISLWLTDSSMNWTESRIAYGAGIHPKFNEIGIYKFTLKKHGSDNDINNVILRIDNINSVPSTYNFRFALMRDDTLHGLLYESMNYDTDICFWGDSLTAGAGGNGVTFPQVCANELSLSYINAGVGGENANTIACRQGGNNLVLPPGQVNQYQLTDFKDIYGVQCNPLRQGGNITVNPIYINGIECNLTLSQSSTTSQNATYTITGYTNTLLAETPIKFSGCNITSRITVIFVGQNGPYFEQRLSVIDSMISRVNENYIVLGLTSGTLEDRKTEENTMRDRYGVHYFNTRNMLCKYGCAIVGITPTATDLEEMKVGKVPSSLRSDSVHLNANGYRALGKMLASKIRANGYA